MRSSVTFSLLLVLWQYFCQRNYFMMCSVLSPITDFGWSFSVVYMSSLLPFSSVTFCSLDKAFEEKPSIRRKLSHKPSLWNWFILNCFTHSVKEVFKYLILADLQPSREAAPNSHFLGGCFCTASSVPALTLRAWVVRTPEVLGEMRLADVAQYWKRLLLALWDLGGSHLCCVLY